MLVALSDYAKIHNKSSEQLSLLQLRQPMTFYFHADFVIPKGK